MLRFFQAWCFPRQDRNWINEVGWLICRTALFTIVTVLIRRIAFRTYASDITIGQKHAFLFIIGLLDHFSSYAVILFEFFINLFDQAFIFIGMSRMVIIKRHMKIFKVIFMLTGIFRCKFLWLNPQIFSTQHDWSSVSITCTDKNHIMSLHSQKSRPNISLNIANHMTDMNGAIGIRQSIGYKNFLIFKTHDVWNILPEFH